MFGRRMVAVHDRALVQWYRNSRYLTCRTLHLDYKQRWLGSGMSDQIPDLSVLASDYPSRFFSGAIRLGYTYMTNR